MLNYGPNPLIHGFHGHRPTTGDCMKSGRVPTVAARQGNDREADVFRGPDERGIWKERREEGGTSCVTGLAYFGEMLASLATIPKT